MPPAELPLFPGLVAEMLGDLAEANRLAREDALTSELVTYCRMVRVPAVLPDTIEAGDAWGANCGPMSLAAVLGLPTVEAARRLVQPFRGFMSPTDMVAALQRGFGLTERWANLGLQAADPWPQLGLVRIQWVGPWCELANPRAAYKFTHWVGVRTPTFESMTSHERGVMIYDATPNRWVPLWAWERWCLTLWPKRATGWAPVTRIDVTLPTGPKVQVKP